tara:strand:- start:525 stop:1703 length:1179 start_codon:yes stop_codon:yes gene_type:complete
LNNSILNTGVQDFIEKKWNTDMLSVILKKPLFEGVSQKELVEQVEAKKKSKDKLPTWFKTQNIYYPNKLNIEQTSSEITAQYKANLIAGYSLIDITGGYGVDSYFFSQKFNQIYHSEIDENLSKIAAYNFKILGAKNIKCIAQNGVDFLQKNDSNFDWIFIDPSRRNNAKEKVFFMADCLPNVPENLDLFFKASSNILIKTSPLLDFTIGIKEFQFVKEIHVVAVQNEVKELLWILEKKYEGSIAIKTVNIAKNTTESFNFKLTDEKEVISEYAKPLSYLYEPNSAILKSGAFKSIGNHFKVKKIHEHSHLYTSNDFKDFPGRKFKIVQTIPYSKKEMKKLGISKANITTRNFLDSVAVIRNKYKIKDGGEIYLFFTKNIEDEFIVLKCEKA